MVKHRPALAVVPICCPQTLKGGGTIAAGRLYVKVDHRRDDELGPTLKSGTVGVKLVER